MPQERLLRKPQPDLCRSSINSLVFNIIVKAEKCEFHASTVTFLGHIITQGQVRMDPEKVRAVFDWPKPDNRKQLQRFLGFANFYRCFIRNYSRIAAPLTALTSPVRGGHLMLNELFLSWRKGSPQQFVVEVDASDVGIGAVLSQQSPEDKKLHLPFCPIVYLSQRGIMMLETASCWKSSWHLRSYLYVTRKVNWEPALVCSDDL